jgi:uncharacterized C2H2 Zn-finger protein
MSKTGIFKCPRCGFLLDEKEKKAYGNNIRQKTLNYSRLTRRLLNKVSTLIMTNIPSDNSQKNYVQFLTLVKDVDENVLRRILSNYLEKNYAQQGKGFRYLSSMILTENQNKDTKLANEYKSSGRSPSFDLVK